LKRHYVDSLVYQHGHVARPGEAMVAAARGLASDLIVMGSYGHAPLRERMFGGATRSVLASLPAPVQMAH